MAKQLTMLHDQYLKSLGYIDAYNIQEQEQFDEPMTHRLDLSAFCAAHMMDFEEMEELREYLEKRGVE